ncbi:hypothetical protein [Rubrivirga marina]|uniref:NAD(+)--protein-arginine ADP-ribosyltransferase Tre1-like N-terminal domain-containing protein n=1 Tax=Rubrivirga marina TaxID=1196024 RepID=A0A271J567_9BACT|nr:hypothetical protein [Rubrivirga marina]PAP77829.1 hypothetical protein BSZ37_15955 [Rubrivirga marina]
MVRSQVTLLALVATLVAPAIAQVSPDRGRRADAILGAGIGGVVDSLRGTGTLAQEFQAGACAAADPTARSLCNNEVLAAEFEARFDTEATLRQSLETLVDLGALSRDDARAVRALSVRESRLDREQARGRLLDSASPLARQLAGQLAPETETGVEYVSSSATDGATVAATIIAGAALGAQLGAAAGGIGALPGAAIGAVATAGFIAVYAGLDSQASGDGRGDDDDDESDDGGTTDQEGEAGPNLPGEAGGGGGTG